MPVTSSSISASEAQAGPPAWRRFAGVLLAATVALLLVLVALACAVDPYDTGRSALIVKPGVRPQGPRTANASRGRDPAFTGAIFGNSHIQLVDPERLRAATGIPFVQLSVPGSGPKEQLVLADWFLRHHQGTAQAIVLGIDSTWCTRDPALPNWNPFPFWLYSANPLEYLRGLLRFGTIESVVTRLRYLAARNPTRARPDGYWDYEPEYKRLGYGTDPALRARLEEHPSDEVAENPMGRFPAAERLRALLEALPPEVRVVLVFPPVYVALLPRPGTVRARAEEACKAAFSALAARPHTAVVDRRIDGPEVRDPALFFDQSHYRHPLARMVEDHIEEALRRL